MKKSKAFIITSTVLLLALITPFQSAEAAQIDSGTATTFYGTYETPPKASTDTVSNSSNRTTQINRQRVPILPRTGANHNNPLQKAGLLLLVILGIFVRRRDRSERKGYLL